MCSSDLDVNPKDELTNVNYQANLKDIFDPSAESREWFPRWLVQMTAPSKYWAWEQGQSKKSDSKKRKSAEHLDTASKRPRGRPPKQQVSNYASHAPLYGSEMLPASRSTAALDKHYRAPSLQAKGQFSKSTPMPQSQTGAHCIARVEEIDLTGD